jgi:NAD(P)-dependent dehydrogenase (short-subunit alcohol dehydrogenase family)
MQPAEFDGAQVYVVGGSLGIGLAVAQRVAALGAGVSGVRLPLPAHAHFST